MNERSGITILGVRITDIPFRALNDLLESLLQKDGSVRHIVTINPEYIIEAQKNAPFRECLNRSALALADGIGIVYAVKHICGRTLERITGVDATFALADVCARTGKKFYLLGAGPGVARRAADELVKRFPRLRIAGAEEGREQRREDKSQVAEDSGVDLEICKRITESGADVLLVAFGAPTQDLWIAYHAADLPRVKIAMGVGGTFDYLAGVVPRAPSGVRMIGFEWLYRLIRQPHRARRIFIAVVLFPLAVLFSKR